MRRAKSSKNSITDHFFYLEAGREDLMGSELTTRTIELKLARGDALVAFDSARRKHLLVPVDEDVLTEDDALKGVGLTNRNLAISGTAVHYADLYCKVPGLGGVFERLVEDIVDRLRAGAGPPESTVVETVDEWRALLEAEPDPLSPAERVGLVGELTVMRRLAVYSPLSAVNSWIGPEGANHDFVRDGMAIEVKGTTSHEGRRVHVSSLDQLDTALAHELYLVVAHLAEDEAGQSIDDMVSELIELGVPARRLISKVAGLGHVYQSSLAAPTRYAVRSLKSWRVDDNFPGLRRSDLSEVRLRGVSKLRYILDLDSAPPPSDDNETERNFAVFAGSAKNSMDGSLGEWE